MRQIKVIKKKIITFTPAGALPPPTALPVFVAITPTIHNIVMNGDTGEELRSTVKTSRQHEEPPPRKHGGDRKSAKAKEEIKPDNVILDEVVEYGNSKAYTLRQLLQMAHGEPFASSCT